MADRGDMKFLYECWKIILLINIQRNVQNLQTVEGRITKQILGVKGLNMYLRSVTYTTISIFLIQRFW